MLSGTDGNVSTSDFSVDIETFGTYLNAELNGNAELGVDRIADPALRESLESIKSEYDKVLKSAAATVLKMVARLSMFVRLLLRFSLNRM